MFDLGSIELALVTYKYFQALELGVYWRVYLFTEATKPQCVRLGLD